MEDVLDRLNWSYVIVAVGFFMGCLLISLVLLYGHTKGRWNWRKGLRFVLILTILAVVGGVSYPPLKRMSVEEYYRKEEAKEMERRKSEKMILLGDVRLGMNEEEILLLLGHPSEEKFLDGVREYKVIVYREKNSYMSREDLKYEIELWNGVCRSVKTVIGSGYDLPSSEEGQRLNLSTSDLTPYEPADEVINRTAKEVEPSQIRCYYDNNLKVEIVRGLIETIWVADGEWLSRGRAK